MIGILRDQDLPIGVRKLDADLQRRAREVMAAIPSTRKTPSGTTWWKRPIANSCTDRVANQRLVATTRR